MKDAKMSMKSLVSRKGLLASIQVAVVLMVAACGAPVKREDVVLPVFPPPPDEPRFYFERSIYSTADVSKTGKNSDMKRMLTGESESGEAMTKPYGVAVYHGRVFVTDSGARSVVVFDIPQQRTFRFGESGDGALGMPLGIDTDGKGNVYVVDAAAKNVQMYDKDGKFIKTLAAGSRLSRPSGIAVDNEGARMYVVDTGAVTNEKHRVMVFDIAENKHLFDIGKRGSGEGQFNLPRDITIGTDGLLYVVDGGNFRVQVFKPDGTFVRVFGSVGRQSGQFSRPKEAAVDPDGNVYIVDAAFGNFQIFNTSGQLLLAVGSRSEQDKPAKYMLPSGIAIDGDGRIYMVDQFFQKLDVYRPARLDANGGFTAKKDAPAAKGAAGG
jgi:DNA-binding beta-propeller fold protein YncE